MRRLVQKSSVRLKKLRQLNESAGLMCDVPAGLSQTVSVSSKKQLEFLNAEHQLELFVQEHYEQLSLWIPGIETNKLCYEDYKERTALLKTEADKKLADKMKISLHFYRRMEEKMFLESYMIVPLDFKVKIVGVYESPQGKNSYQRQWEFSFEEVKMVFDRVDHRMSYKSDADRQRALLTSSLRYDILKRDGFRCVICGRTAEDGIKLHVDHIIPVSKGGLSEPSNLRTLCSDCNLGKGDKIEQI